MASLLVRGTVFGRRFCPALSVFAVKARAPMQARPFLSASPQRVFTFPSIVLQRYFSSQHGGHEKALRDLGDKFGEARLEIEDARESVGTVYYNEDHKAAQELVEEVLSDYKTLLESVDGPVHTNIMQTWGLKIEQLKGELKELEDAGGDHHDDH
eukprot:comp21512_c0_seq1/m.29849 comp21512_c0_seq1/g.29849  ORF comp21512_c0_seq1/g.29849 comp21512_c0_seq1/m.29849 type:complete len:155 (-) comp21512_c0_seq1:612-1076(-)